jgi:hypothetical protein
MKKIALRTVGIEPTLGLVKQMATAHVVFGH